MIITHIFLILFSLFNFQFTLEEGDLLFQDSDCGPFCDAIEKVTDGYHGANLSHVGMIIRTDKGEVAVIEAITAGVVITPLEEFLGRSFDANGKSKVIVGRVNESSSHLIPEAVKYAKTLLGKSYDSVFEIGNDQYYCSELIYEAFKFANSGKPLFDLNPMTFIDPETGTTFGIWEDYYYNLGVKIPEGEPGLNPGGISRSDKLKIVHRFGVPSGITK